MSIFDRSSLESSSLADLHAIASELSIDGYRRLRKDELITAILDRQSAGAGEEPPADPLSEALEDSGTTTRRRRGRRGGRGRAASASASAEPSSIPQDASAGEESSEEEPPSTASSGAVEAPPAPSEEPAVEGVVELLPGGSGFVRVSPPDPSDQDVYVSAAQVRRCELVSGDRISGPRRPPRRSERFASLVQVDTVNGRPVSELADTPRFEELPAAFPSELLQLESADPTIAAINSLTPIGRGSRVSITGPSRAGKTEALRRLAAALAGQDELQLWLVLAGARPEEVSEWRGILEPAAVSALGSSLEARSQALEVVIEQVRRLVGRGTNAVVLIDSIDAVHNHVAARALASARNVRADGPDGRVGGSLTVIATAAEPRGGETTVIALDPLRTAAGRFPALDLAHSGTMRPELLVGESSAEDIRRQRSDALE